MVVVDFIGRLMLTMMFIFLMVGLIVSLVYDYKNGRKTCWFDGVLMGMLFILSCIGVIGLWYK